MTVSFRLDRALSVRLAHPLSARRKHKVSQVPVLMYHGVNMEVGRHHPYFETNTSPAVFRKHMNILTQNKYDAIDLGNAINTIEVADGLRGKVVITFDDGYANFYDTAFPILLECGLQATLFIVTSLTATH